MVAEISKLRADAQSNGHVHSTLTAAHTELDKLNSELKHQQTRFEDLQKAYVSLERSVHVPVTNSIPQQQYQQQQQQQQDSDVAYEVNAEGNLQTSTPKRFNHKQTVDNADYTKIERNVQLEAFKVCMLIIV